MVVDFVIPFDSFLVEFTGEIFGSSKNYYILCSHSRQCVCVLYACDFVTCLFTMQDMKLVDLARFSFYVYICVGIETRFNAANDCDNTQNSQLL